MPAITALRVRPASAADADFLTGSNVRLAQESEGMALDPATVRAGVEAVLVDPAKGRYLVATEGDRPVGQLMLTVEWSDWRNGPIYWLQSVYVVADRRGSGVFRALWAEALAVARESGARAVRLYVEQHNRAAQEVYRRVGMASSGYVVFELQPV
jgi:GNAT superfamily N-acetyltransferase